MCEGIRRREVSFRKVLKLKSEGREAEKEILAPRQFAGRTLGCGLGLAISEADPFSSWYEDIHIFLLSPDWTWWCSYFWISHVESRNLTVDNQSSTSSRQIPLVAHHNPRGDVKHEVLCTQDIELHCHQANAWSLFAQQFKTKPEWAESLAEMIITGLASHGFSLPHSSLLETRHGGVRDPSPPLPYPAVCVYLATQSKHP